MKTTRKFLFIVGLLTCFANGLLAQEQTPKEEDDDPEPVGQSGNYPEDVIIKLVEWHEGTIGDRSKMIIIKPDNTTETQELEKARLVYGDLRGVSDNMVRLRMEIQKWHNYGFAVKSSSSTSPNTMITITTVFLQKN